MTRKTRYPIIKNSLKKTLEAQRTVNREGLIRKFYVRDGQDEGKPGDEPTDNAADVKSVSEGTTKAKPSKKGKSKPLRAGKKPPEAALVRLPWVVPPKDGRAQQTPWLNLIEQPSSQKGDAMSILDNELLSLTAFLKPSSTEQAAVSYITDDLSSKLQSIVQNPPQLIGSRYAQLATSISVIDLMIFVDDDRIPNVPKNKPPGINPQMRYKYLKILTQAGDVLKNDFIYRDYQIIPDKSPSLLLFHRSSGLPVRLVCRSHAPKLEGFIRESLPDLPSLPPLYMIMRILLESKSLFGWEVASLNSNGLFLLIMSFLRQQERDSTSNSLGEQLLSFLHTYGKQIDLITTGVSAHPAEFFTMSAIRQRAKSLKKDKTTVPDYLKGQRSMMNAKIHARYKGNTRAANHLCIQDPTNYLIDAGERCSRTAELQETFSGLYDDLKLALKRWDEGHKDDGSILGQVLRADFEELVRRKRMLAL